MDSPLIEFMGNSSLLSPVQNVVILGDLNAGCSYVTIKGWRALRLRADPKFHWLIGDEQDTTVREKTHCAYDRSETLDSAAFGTFSL